MIYPKEGKEENWARHMSKATQRGLITKKESDLCLKAGGIPEALIEKIKSRIYLYQAIWELIQRQLGLE